MDLTEDEIGDLLGAIAARIPRSAAERAMQVIYEGFSLSVRNYVWKNWTRDTHIIEEVVQDTLFEVWRQPERFRGESRFKTWLLGIARNKAVDKLRKSRPTEDLSEELEQTLAAEMPTITDVIAVEQIRMSLRACMDSLTVAGRLSQAHREILHLAYVEDLDIAEMAQIVQCPENTVKTRLHHARLRIKDCMSRRLLSGECHDQ
ncbi:RNA polymerase sigma factor [Methyloterricola oryzae]|uniref:RNA polymerase sigma factor n=1 Tax=Methyloterricola oryzae TaxID=1495050 RepID=UPI0005EB9FCD|nr:sigma-70 family RNA polymerase sigma factor [Methyloterricola oryzae]